MRSTSRLVGHAPAAASEVEQRDPQHLMMSMLSAFRHLMGDHRSPIKLLTPRPSPRLPVYAPEEPELETEAGADDKRASPMPPASTALALMGPQRSHPPERPSVHESTKLILAQMQSRPMQLAEEAGDAADPEARPKRKAHPKSKGQAKTQKQPPADRKSKAKTEPKGQSNRQKQPPAETSEPKTTKGKSKAEAKQRSEKGDAKPRSVISVEWSREQVMTRGVVLPLVRNTILCDRSIHVRMCLFVLWPHQQRQHRHRLIVLEVFRSQPSFEHKQRLVYVDLQFVLHVVLRCGRHRHVSAILGAVACMRRQAATASARGSSSTSGAASKQPCALRSGIAADLSGRGAAGAADGEPPRAGYLRGGARWRALQT